MLQVGVKNTTGHKRGITTPKENNTEMEIVASFLNGDYSLRELILSFKNNYLGVQIGPSWERNKKYFQVSYFPGRYINSTKALISG